MYYDGNGNDNDHCPMSLVTLNGSTMILSTKIEDTNVYIGNVDCDVLCIRLAYIARALTLSLYRSFQYNFSKRFDDDGDSALMLDIITLHCIL